MSVTVRLTCDEPGCGQHFDVEAPDLRPRTGPSMATPAGRCPTVVFGAPYAILPAGWHVSSARGVVVRVRCASHDPIGILLERDADHRRARPHCPICGGVHPPDLDCRAAQPEGLAADGAL